MYRFSTPSCTWQLHRSCSLCSLWAWAYYQRFNACLQPKKIKVWGLKLRELVRDLAQIFSARPAANLSSIRLKSSIFPRTGKHARPAVLIYNDGLLASYMQLFVHDRRFADLPYIFCIISPPRAKRRYDNKTVSPKRVEIDSCWKELIFKIKSPII